MKLQNPHQFYKRVLIIWGLLILLVSSIPSLSLPLPDKLGFDKVAHFCQYFILGAIYSLMMYHGKKSFTITYRFVILLIVFAFLDEWHQKLIPGRAYSLWDFSADFAGILFGWSTAYVWMLIREKK
jgi:VanZ family protein